MASIKRLTDKPRTLPWRAKVQGKVRMFLTKDEAERWASEYARTLRLTGLPPTIEALKKYTVKDIVTRYRDEITPAKGCRVSETAVLNSFLRRKDVCSKSLAHFRNKEEAYKYVSDRLKETWRGKPITPRTVRREVNTLQHVFEVAKERWGMENLFNPFRELNIKGSEHRRKRRLQEGELERLIEACEGCRGLNQQYVPLAIYLAVETGMRLQEIFNLTWLDIDPPNRRIEIRKSKTDHVSQTAGRTIVMSVGARLVIARLFARAYPALDADPLKFRELIFPMTKGAFEQSWADVRRRAGITADARGEMLEFKDLRREAGSRFDEAGLTKAEHDLMMGHADKSMASIYIAAPLKSIQDKLDRHLFNGRTFDEAYKQAKENKAKGNEGSGIEHPVIKQAIELEGSNVIPFPSSKAS
jgi:integrase